MQTKKSVKDLDAGGRRVFLRVDFNVPLDETGQISDDRRIRESLPTIRLLLERKARVILASHLGRPKGKRNPKMSLRPVAARLERLLGQPVAFCEDCIGPEAERMAAALRDGEVLLLENLRFHAAEEMNDPQFAGQLARLAELYVNDAFGTAHRAHASTEGVVRHLRPAVAGLLIEKELGYLGAALTNPRRPALAILGGAKVSSKISVLTNLMRKVDSLAIGGGMAFTFLKARGGEIGSSLFEPETLDTAKSILAQDRENGVKLLLPSDCVIADKLDANSQTRIVPADAIPEGWIGVDIGPDTIGRIKEEIAGAGTVIWNGPLGVFEIAPFSRGTREVAEALAESKAVTILGGGETAAAAERFGVAGRMSHISTGGGASLEFLEGRNLPGIAVLDDA